jgi:hypothetical protein
MLQTPSKYRGLSELPRVNARLVPCLRPRRARRSVMLLESQSGIHEQCARDGPGSARGLGAIPRDRVDPRPALGGWQVIAGVAGFEGVGRDAHAERVAVRAGKAVRPELVTPQPDLLQEPGVIAAVNFTGAPRLRRSGPVRGLGVGFFGRPRGRLGFGSLLPWTSSANSNCSPKANELKAVMGVYAPAEK